MNRVQRKTNVAVSFVAAVSIVLMVNYLASRHYVRSDWTSSQMYTLSARTEAEVARITTDVRIYVLWSKSDPLLVHVQEILKRYASLSRRIAVETLDPDLNPERFEIISSKYGKIRTDETGQAGIETGVFVVAGDNVRFISSDSFQDFSSDMLDDSGQTPMSSFKAEGEITSALVGVMKKEKRTVCFSQGHGEWRLEEGAKGSLAHVVKNLSLDGFESEPLDIDATTRVPAFCNLLVVAGPDRPFLPREVDVLQKWLKAGNRLTLLLDPMSLESSFLPTGFEKLTADAGIEIASDMVLETDPRRLVSNTMAAFTASEFGSHPSMKSLGGGTVLPVVFSTARSLVVKSREKAMASYLVKTSPMSWGETDLASMNGGETVPEKNDVDTEGPLIIAAASEIDSGDPKKPGRLVVVGDSDFLSRELIANAALYNGDFWNATVGWMTEYRAMISIAPKNPEQVHLTLSKEDSANILFVLACEILLIIGLGIVIIMRRRK